MISSDYELLLEIKGAVYGINARLDKIEAVQIEQGKQITELQKDVTELKAVQEKQGIQIAELQEGQRELKAEIRENRGEIRGLEHQIDGLQTSTGWIFAGIGLIIAIIALFKGEKPEPEHKKIITSWK